MTTDEQEKNPKQASVDNGNVSVDKGPDKKGHFHKGLTKREHFAGLAMQALVASAHDYKLLGRMSVDAADALLLALEEVRP